MKKAKPQFKILTKGEITASAVEELSYRNFDCWPENNVRAVRGRNFTGRLGKPDIIGYNRSWGQFMGCEVKTINDTFSDEQIKFLESLFVSRGFAYVAYQDKDGQLKVEPWNMYRNEHPNILKRIKENGL